MEKLIKLLNEYENWKRGERTLWGYTWWMLYYIQSCDRYLGLKIISNKYWFIKRLVQNDKVDLDGIEQRAIEFFYDESPVRWKEIRAERLIMMLSVQDNPIEDLISFLR